MVAPPRAVSGLPRDHLAETRPVVSMHNPVVSRIPRRQAALAAVVATALLAFGVVSVASADDEGVPPVPQEQGTGDQAPDPAPEPVETALPDPTLWVDPTRPDLLLSQPEPAATDEPTVPRPSKPAPDREEERRGHADAAPPLSPGFVDDYTRLWRSIEAGRERVAVLKGRLADARLTAEATSSDLATAMRVRNRAEFGFKDAEDQLDIAVQDLYISGTTDVDVVMGVLGSEPEEMLRGLDAVIYLRSATGSEVVDLRTARSAAVTAQSAAASTQMRMDDDRERLADVERSLVKTRSRLTSDRKELDALIASAAPQTVVGPSGCPKAVLDGTVPAGVDVRDLCRRAVKGAATPQAAFAIKWALVRLGAPYACEGVGRLAPWRYDCSSYVSRAYAEGAGLQTATEGWAPSTRTMVPWDGAALDPHYARIAPDRLKPGDLVLYDTCPAGEVCDYQHVVMYLGPATPGGAPLMAHTNTCGGVAHVAPFPGTDAANFLGVRRVIPAAGERVRAPKGALVSPAGAATRG